MNRDTPRFLFAAVRLDLKDFHLTRPFIEVPLVFAKSGFRADLLVHSKGAVGNAIPGEIAVLEVRDVSPHNSVLGYPVGSMLRELDRDPPSVLLHFHMSPYLPAIVGLSRLTQFVRRLRSPASPRTRWLLKMDWDGTPRLRSRLLNAVWGCLLAIHTHLMDDVLVESSCGLARARSTPLVRADRLRLVPNTASETTFPATRYENGSRERTILSVGRIAPEKGFEDIIDALGTLTERHPDWRLDIVGPVEDARYHRDLIQRSMDKRIDHLIRFRGPLFGEVLRSAYTGASIYCCSSRFEAAPIARYEAAASGLPIVTSEAGCGDDFRSWGSLIYRHGNPKELAECLESLMTQPDLRQRISDRQLGQLRRYNRLYERFLS